MVSPLLRLGLFFGVLLGLLTGSLAENFRLRPWEPRCEACVHRESNSGCPDPEACGYLPVRCVFCLDGVPMPNCPRPDWCGYKAVGLRPSSATTPADQRDLLLVSLETSTGTEEDRRSGGRRWQASELRPLEVSAAHMHGDCAMAMNFNVMERDFCLLFKSWKITSAGGFFLAALFVFSLSFCRETLDVFSTRFRKQRILGAGAPLSIQPVSPPSPTDSMPLLEDSRESQGGLASTATLKFRVEGLTCSRCEDTLSRGIPQNVEIPGVRVSFVSWEAGEVWVTCSVADLPAALHLIPGTIADLGYTSLPAQDDDRQAHIACLRLNVSGLTGRESAAQVSYTLEQVAGGEVEVSPHHNEAWVPVGGPDSKDLAVLIPSLEDSLRQLGYESSVEAVTPLLSAGPVGIDLKLQAVHSAIHAVLLLTAYILMLVVMTYNVMLCICLLGGCAIGHYVSHYQVFGGKVIRAEPTEADHCCQQS